MCALTLALIRSACDASNFYAVEGFVGLQLVLMFCFTSTHGICFRFTGCFTALLDGHFSLAAIQTPLRPRFPWPSWRSRLSLGHSNAAPLRLTTQDMFAIAASILNLWYWVSGIHTQPSCGRLLNICFPVCTIRCGPQRSCRVPCCFEYLLRPLQLLVHSNLCLCRGCQEVATDALRSPATPIYDRLRCPPSLL